MSDAAPYPLFPTFGAGQIVEFLVFRDMMPKKGKKPTWQQFWPTHNFSLELTERQFTKLVGGGHFEIRAFGEANDKDPLAIHAVKSVGGMRENPPDIEQQQALLAPTAHETAQRALVTVPGISPELNAAFAAFQMQSTNYREDSQKTLAAMFELLGAFIAREKNTTLEQQLITDLRNENRKLAASHDKLMEKLQEAELEGVELEQRGKGRHGLAGMAVEAIADKLPDIVQPLLGRALQELLAKPEYVKTVAEAHGKLNATTLGDAAAE